jgi:hypothetical protein
VAAKTSARPETKGRPTLYKGIRMRSRLEAKYAAYLDLYEVPWEYEPECFAGPEGQWLPDFRYGTGNSYVEVKPMELFRFRDGNVDAREKRVDAILAQMSITWHSVPAARLSLVFLDYSREDPDVTIAACSDGPWRVFVPDHPLLNAIWPGMGQLESVAPANRHIATGTTNAR